MSPDFQPLADFFRGFFSAVWSLFSVRSPIFGLTFGTLTLGIFFVSVSLRVLVPLLGIGGAVATVGLSAPRRSKKPKTQAVQKYEGASHDKKSD